MIFKKTHAMSKRHTDEWTVLQTLVLKYVGMSEGRNKERQELRRQIAAHLAGVFFVCIGDLAEGKGATTGDESGARFERRGSKLEQLIQEELRLHKRESGGQRLLQAAHGGTAAFAPVAAQAFLEERSLRAARGATFLTALFQGWDGRGTLEGFLRLCVRHFLADMAAARRPKKRKGVARIPNTASDEEAAQLRARYERRQALLRGEAPILVLDGLGDEDNGGGTLDIDRSQALDNRGHSTTEWDAELNRFRELVDHVLERLDPLDAALLRQEMGLEPEEEGKALAARFGLTPSAVSQRRSRLIGELRRALGVDPSD